MKKAALLGLVVLLLFAGAEPVHSADALRVARWYKDKEGAVSLRFDDSLESQMDIAVPLLNRYGFKATFMVNPGTERYKRRREFWESRLLAMGHELGDHTMHHSGARDVKDADYEIGEAASVIRRVSPKGSGLLVFASGGGAKWGRRDWEQAGPEYRGLVEKYRLIDLYDGKHQSLAVGSKDRAEELCGRVDDTLARHGYQAFHFHDIGRTSFINSLKAFVRGYDLTTDEKTFSGFLECLGARGDRLWVAPVADILKYQEEASGATLRVLESGRRACTIALDVKTDTSLYDHELTLVLPARRGMDVTRVTQDGRDCRVYRGKDGTYLMDVRPLNGKVEVSFDAHTADH